MWTRLKTLVNFKPSDNISRRVDTELVNEFSVKVAVSKIKQLIERYDSKDQKVELKWS